MTALERLRFLAGGSATTGQALKSIGGAASIAGALLVAFSGLSSVSAQTHLLHDKQGGFGFEMRTVREVQHQTLLQRVLQAKAERVKPVKKSARKKALAIEFKAAELVQSGGSESAFFVLLEQWLALAPQLPTETADAEQLFMAQVALRILALQQQDDEEALLALML